MRGVVIRTPAEMPKAAHGAKPSEQAEVRLTAWPTYCWTSLWLPSAALNKRSSQAADRLRRSRFEAVEQPCCGLIEQARAAAANHMRSKKPPAGDGGGLGGPARARVALKAQLASRPPVTEMPVILPPMR